LIKTFVATTKLIGAICAAPILLEDANFLHEKKYTAHGCVHPLIQEPPENATVVEDGNLITANGPGAAIPFAIALARYLNGPEAGKELALSMGLDS
jgi:4-methyl-5(b-hydroxyethyl)-thiazole monophosphate biosynthesis